MYPPSLTLEWNDGTGDGGSGASVVWTDLKVGIAGGSLYTLPKEAWVQDAAELRRVAPRVYFDWLCKAGVSLPVNYFIRIADTGCRSWNVWEVHAVLLLLAGYSARDVAYGAARALSRRGEPREARALVKLWIDGRLLSRWVRAISSAQAGPNDRATVQKVLAHRDARIPRDLRGRWVEEVGVIQPGMDRTACNGSLRCDARDKRVRFAI